MLSTPLMQSLMIELALHSLPITHKRLFPCLQFQVKLPYWVDIVPTYLQPAEAGIVVGGAQQTMAGMHDRIVDLILKKGSGFLQNDIHDHSFSEHLELVLISI